MPSQRELRQKQETPNEGDQIAHNHAGQAGDPYTYDEKREGDLPPREPTDLPTDFASADERAEYMLEAAGIGTAAAHALHEEAKHRRQITLPPYVEVMQADGQSSYVFVPPDEARSLGFQRTLLGTDDGSGVALSGISEKAWTLSGQVSVAIAKERAHVQDMSAEQRRQAKMPPQNAAYIPPDTALSTGPEGEEMLYQTEENGRMSLLQQYHDAEVGNAQATEQAVDVVQHAMEDTKPESFTPDMDAEERRRREAAGLAAENAPAPNPPEPE